MKKDKVLVTGGNGFIGSHIVNKLVDQGYKVAVVCRRKNSHNIEFNKHLADGKIELFQGSIEDFDYSQIGEVNYIIHTAGKVSVYGSMKDFLRTNTEATMRLLDYAKSLKNLKCFTYLSTAAVYGYDGYFHLKEDAEKKPFNNPYPITKLKTENYLIDFCQKNSIDYCIIRPGNVYGEYDYTSSHEIYSRVKRCKMSICARGRYRSCFVYAGNLANAIIHTTLNKEFHNTDYNVTDSNDETLKEYLTSVANAFGVKPKFINFPAPLAKCVATLIEGIYKLFRIKKAPLITRFSIWQNCTDYNFSIEKLLSTGYTKETDEKTAIKRTADWYNSIDKKNK